MSTRSYFDGNPNCSRNRLGDLVVVHLDRAIQGINLAIARLRVLEDGSDHIRLVDPGDESVTTAFERETDYAPVSLTAPLPVDPFGEQRRPQVGGEHRSAVEQVSRRASAGAMRC
jgi:hypothetical protein